MLPETAQRMGFKKGDYIQIDHDERGTVVVRELVGCNRGCFGMHSGYVYMDSLSAHYLNTELHDEVRVKQAEYPLDCP